ncbi:MAG: hypothetical protein AAF225_05660 [Pseudomonadota bacterium]
MTKSFGCGAGLVAVLLVGAFAVPAHAQLAEDARALAEENYAQANTDGEPGLTADEFEAFVRANAEDDIGMSRRIRRFNAFDRAFNTVNANGDDIVTWDEFVALSSQN